MLHGLCCSTWWSYELLTFYYDPKCLSCVDELKVVGDWFVVVIIQPLIAVHNKNISCSGTPFEIQTFLGGVFSVLFSVCVRMCVQQCMQGRSQ